MSARGGAAGRRARITAIAAFAVLPACRFPCVWHRASNSDGFVGERFAAVLAASPSFVEAWSWRDGGGGASLRRGRAYAVAAYDETGVQVFTDLSSQSLEVELTKECIALQRDLVADLERALPGSFVGPWRYGGHLPETADYQALLVPEPPFEPELPALPESGASTDSRRSR